MLWSRVQVSFDIQLCLVQIFCGFYLTPLGFCFLRALFNPSVLLLLDEGKQDESSTISGGKNKNWDWRINQGMTPGGRRCGKDIAESSFIPERFRNTGPERRHKAWDINYLDKDQSVCSAVCTWNCYKINTDKIMHTLQKKNRITGLWSGNWVCMISTWVLYY